MKKSLVLAIIVFGLWGCSTWPPHGHGGAAEEAPAHNIDRPNHIRLIAAQRELLILRDFAGETHFPAKLIKAQQQWNRSARAFDGHFSKAASLDLDQLDVMLSAMRKILTRKMDGSDKLIADRIHEVLK